MRPASALTPALALDYVRELSTDVLAGVALAAGGERLAGPEELAAPARALLAAAGAAAELRGGDGPAAASAPSARSATRWSSRAARSRCPRWSRRDLRTALAELEGRAASARRRSRFRRRPTRRLQRGRRRPDIRGPARDPGVAGLTRWRQMHARKKPQIAAISPDSAA